MINVKDLHKSFNGVEVLKGIDESVEEGEVVVVIGPSGSGKSTFLRCLNLLEKPDSGEVWVDDQQINAHGVNKNQVRQKMGMVFQHFNLFPHLTVKKNITLAPVKLKKMTKEEADKKAKAEIHQGLPGVVAGKRATGLPPHASLLDCRLKKGCELLRKGESVGAVSSHLGFSSPRHFATALKRATGRSPRDLRA